VIDADLRYRIESSLNESIDRIFPVSGGCIGKTARLIAGDRSYFIKWGSGIVSGTFEAEARGLAELGRAAGLVRIPAVIDVIRLENDRGALIIEWVETGSARASTWSRLGEGLAEIHRSSAERYGFVADNYIGSSVQDNTRSNDWVCFFRERRLSPQVQLARSRSLWRRKWDRAIERLYVRLGVLLPATPEVSLVHGDLWRGNVMVDIGGNPVLIDPAVHYGHREVDLAMSRLFGSLNAGFYDAYSSVWAMDGGHSEREEIYNLYHLINHLNLFGDAYAASVDSILRRF